MRKLFVAISLFAVLGIGAFALLNNSSSIQVKSLNHETVMSCSDCAGWGSGGG